MSEYSVDVGLNLDSGGYVASMGEALNVTKQFAGVATGVGGAVVDMNKRLVGAAMSVTGFSKVSTVAVDTAAAYQVQLSKIEASSKLTGTSFDKLAKTTKGFARDFPVGMGTAVQVVQSLQGQGIKSEKQIESLGKSFIKLGAATGSSAAAIGTEFLQLTKTMGNGTAQFEKLSDSLVTTTAKIGGSVPSVVSFSKALAPVAATVGMSQTAVIGLSTAMSKMGEDGFQAANSFNKVLLDMNRAVRDGGPELKSYADMMGTTTEKLKSMFKTNPSEVLAQFSESVAKAGPDITRQLDALGFDSVRTTRSLTALARSGGPRAAIQTAVDSYGNGATDLASEVAMDGLADQTAKLQETMSQVVQDVGQPLLGFAKAALSPAQAVASGVQTVTGSDVGQKALGATGVVGAGIGVIGNIVTVATVAALAKMGFGAIKNSGPVKNFMLGRADAASGLDAPAGPGGPRALGFANKAAFGGGMQGGLQASSVAGARWAGNTMARLGGMAAEVGARVNHAGTNQMGVLPGGGRWFGGVGITPEMAQGRSDMKDSIRSARDAAKSGSLGGVGSSLRQLGGQAFRYAATADVGLGSGVANLGRSYGLLAARSAVGVGGMAMQGVGMVGKGLGAIGMGGPMGAVVAGGAAAAYVAGKQSDQDATRARVFEARSDIYSRYNDFAEAIGKAGKGVSAFSVDIVKTQQTLVAGNKTWKDAFEVSAAEKAQALSPNYKPGLSLYGDSRDAASITVQAQSTLGKTASMDDVSQVMIDVAHYAKGNQALIDTVAKSLEASYGDGKTMSVPYSPADAISSLASNQANGWNPVKMMNEAQGDIAISIANAAGAEGADAAKLYGGSIKYAAGGVEGAGAIGAEEATRLVRGREAFYAATANEDLNASGSKAAQTAIASTFNLSESQQNDSGLGIGIMDSQKFGRLGEGFTFEEFLGGNNAVAKELREKFAAIDNAGVSMSASGGINYGYDLMSKKNDAQVSSEAYLESIGSAASSTEGFGDALSSLSKMLYGVENAALATAKAPSDLTQSDVAKAGGNWDMTQFALDSGDLKKKQEAVNSVLDDVLKRTGGNFSEAQFALSSTAMEANGTSAQRMVLDAAMQQMGARQAVAQAGRSDMSMLTDRVNLGRQAAATPATSQNQEMRTSLISEGAMSSGQQLDSMASVNRAYGAMQLSQMQARRSAGISIAQINAGAALSESRAREDFQQSSGYARQDNATARGRAEADYLKQRSIARRDFNLNQKRSDMQFALSQDRAREDHDKQTLYAEQDFRRQRGNAVADYDKGRMRARRDFDKSMSHATRDFNIGQERAEADFEKNKTRAVEDYNKSRVRMVEDYNKQLSRMIEDSAKSMYDPFKRIAAQMVMDSGQLLSNLADQTKQLEQQTGNLAKARAMGLTDSTIKALGLSDAANAQQLSRIVGDMGGNSAIAGQLNDQVASKAKAAGSLATDAGSVGFARTAEDQATQMARMDADFAQAQARSGEDFALSTERSKADFAKQMADATADFDKSMADSAIDFGTSLERMDAEYATSVIRSNDAFKVGTLRSVADYKLIRAQSITDFKTQMQDMEDAHNLSMGRMQEDFDKQQARALAALMKSIKRLKQDAQIAIAAIGTSVANAALSMEESFYGMLQNSEEGVGAATQFLKIIAGSKIDISDMSDDMKAMYLAAKNLTELPKISIREAEQSTVRAPSVAPEQASPAGHATSASGVMVPVTPVWDWTQISVTDTDWAPIGKAIGDGVTAGMKDSFPGDLSAVFKTGWEVVKRFLGIASPSKLFTEIGENIALGLKDGIKDKIDEAWAKLTDTVPTPTEMWTAVTGAFKTAGEWLGKLGTKIGAWIGDGWDSLWSAVEDFDIGAKVTKAFASVGTYLGTLGTEILKWVGKAWDGLTSLMPSAPDMWESVKETFEGKEGKGGVKGWLDKLPTWFGSIFDKLRSSISDAFIDGIVTPAADAIGKLFEMMDKLKIPPIKVEFDVGLPNLNPFDRDNFGKTTKTRLTLIDTKEIDLVGTLTNPLASFTTVARRANHALGGIVTEPQTALIGEAGYPEAVIPLNQRGAEVLAETMARYVGNSEVRGSRMESYATPVSNYYSNSQDYSTQFNGPITVRAQDPEAMAQKLAARARRQRLAQPIGGTR